MVRQSVDALEFALDGIREPKGVQAGPELLQGRDLRGIAPTGGPEAIQRGLGLVRGLVTLYLLL